MVVFIGKLILFGVYGKVFTGRAGWLAGFICFHSALMTHMFLGDLLFHPIPIHSPRAARALLFRAASLCVMWVWPLSPALGGGSGLRAVPISHPGAEPMLPAPQSYQASPAWCAGISQLIATIRGLRAAERLKEAPLTNAITQTYLSHVSYLIPSQEKRHSSRHCFCLSERDILVPQASIPSASECLFSALGGNNVGLQTQLKSSFSSRTLLSWHWLVPCQGGFKLLLQWILISHAGQGRSCECWWCGWG